MPKSKLTLLVDGNWLLISRLSVLNTNVDDFELCQDLKILMIKSINVVLRTFPMIDNIIFCADGGSWRSKLEIPECLHHDTEGNLVEYKGTRQYSDTINWEYIFSEYESFISLLQRNGITACREKDIEGDDWIYYWSKKLNAEGTNCIIWTKDNDLKQLIQTTDNKYFTIWWNKDTGLFTNFSENNDDDFNFLFNYSVTDNEKIFESIKEKSVNITNINPKTIVIDKILKGDQSDNILPVILRKSKTRNYKISQKDIDYNLNYNDDNEVLNYLSNLLSLKKYSSKIDKTLDEIFEHFKYNRQLVALQDSSYPKEIKDVFNEYSTYNINKNLYNAEIEIQASANKIKGILDII